MKNKLTVMIITFVILIGITPLIFGKLMNSRFNTMILKSQQQKGIVAKEVKNKSSYLTTDRTFEVTIPGSVIHQKRIKSIKLLTEVKFKNLPVTNVWFHNIVKDVELQNGEKIPFFKKIVFDVTTPDFKTYAFVIKPLKYKTFNLSSVEGTFKIDKDISKLNINTISLTDRKLRFYVDDFLSVTQKNKNLFKTENKFNLHLQFMDKNISVNNVDILSSLKIAKKADINLKLSFKNLLFSKIIRANDFNTKIRIYDLNSSILNKAVSSKDKNLTLALLANGFKTKITSSLKNFMFLGFNQGGFNLNIKTTVYKAKSLKDFENNFKKYLAISIKADISENFAKMLKDSFPLTRQFLNIPPDKNGIIHIRINLDRGQIK